ncbi:MAG TPA: undecaprenyldiphospho-muramoylpentapeptide beta-N-acetylglucosaminyltransferase [candidate division Zixibacteria bacterium]|jgi:UDP-N-acetylglucosamine--N-acetylmuramyl-(pentapeptide) pyrophosphoryl-undecaprenol N-acetylglucosamine transferase
MRILLAAGGTGGHLIPAIRIAEALQRCRPDCEMMFIGSDKGFEERVVTARGYTYVGLPARGLSRRRPWRNIPALWRNWQARQLSQRIVGKFAPDIAVGCGGYASYFPIRACARRGVPYVLQEQNSYPGLATRWLAPGARCVFLAFPQSRGYLKSDVHIEPVGNPVDPRLSTMTREEARRAWNLDIHTRVILLTGGSGGARSMNANIAMGLSRVSPAVPTTLLWQSGRHADESGGNAHAGWTVRRFTFSDQMTEAMVASDLVIGRAGALTVSEIAAAGRPAILVPYPYATADHQMHNARVLSDAGAAIIIEDCELKCDSLLERALRLLDDSSRMQSMAQASRALGQPNAADRIADRILGIVTTPPSTREKTS